MSEERRQLATIMFTDMVGYSALTQKNEALALTLLDEQRRLLRALFAEHRGREIEAVGDGFFVEFGSALDGARCAVAIQQKLFARNSTMSPDQRIQVRIGLHLGDVVHRQNRVHGDGVNIAARIEPLAEAGGICLSEDMARQVQNKLELPLRKLGRGELKNIQIPVDIYRVVLPWERRPLPFSERVAFALRRRRPRRLAAVTVAVLVVLVVAGPYVWQRTRSRPGAVAKQRVAVLPFANMSGNADNEYFSDGITEELISRLSRIAGLEVIARTSVMSYKGTVKKIAEIGRELNVGTVLEGSVRKAANKVRITAQLINVENQAHLWSEDYDREATDIFAVQAGIAQRVAEALRVHLLARERKELEKRGTEDIEAYTLYLQGRFHANKGTEEGLRKGLAYFRRAVERDARYANAHAGIADAWALLPVLATVEPREAFPKARAAAERALTLDDGSAEAHRSLAYVQMLYDWDWGRAEQEFRRAIALNPNYAAAHHGYGWYLVIRRRFDEGIAEMGRAAELDPVSVLINVDLAWVLMMAGRYDRAVEQARKAQEIDPTSYWPLVSLGYSLTMVGRAEEALAAFEREVKIVGREPWALADLGYAYARMGRVRDALKVVEEMRRKSKGQVTPAYLFALPYWALAERDPAYSGRFLEELEKALGQRDSLLTYFISGHYFDRWRSDPRFLAILRKMGLAE